VTNEGLLIRPARLGGAGSKESIMSHQLQHEIEKIKKSILTLGAVVEERVAKAVLSIENGDADLARGVIDGDPEIDRMEVDLEEDCLKILALHQPVAIDLRFIVSVIKINGELERIGDLAVSISERSLFLASQKPTDIPFDFGGMSEKVKRMLKNSLDALVNMDAPLATRVIDADDAIDSANRAMYQTVRQAIRKHPERVECLLHLWSVSRHLERIADHTTNIAEDVIYMIQGTIVRHQEKDS
jgi:phosphate transport system protein